MAEIGYERSGRIGVVTLNRPERRNSLTYAALNELAATVAAAGRDPAVSALVLTGSGGAFCAGTDLTELAVRPAGEPGNVDWDAPRGGWFLIDCPKPVVAAVDGPAVGMGAELSCQADLRIASDRARFSWIFPQRGLVPDMGVSSLLLPRIVGLPASLDLMYSGRFVDAGEAARLGYVSEVTAPGDEVDRAIELAGRLSEGSPFAVARIKRLVYAGLAEADGHLARHGQALAECLASADHREGVRAFLERRPPVFGNR